MAAIGNEPERSLVRVFAEFSLLPDLLAKVSPRQQVQTLDVWRVFLQGSGVNTDHVEDEDIQEGLDEEHVMAMDVWALCKRLGLILPNGQLSEEAQSLARLSDLPKYYRNDMDYPAVSRVLARQIAEQFRGVNGLPIVNLLQDCARALKNSDSAWIALCPGLLLVEVQYLIEIAHTDIDLAQQQELQLVAQRDSIMQDIDMSDPTPGNEIDDMLDHADAVTRYYLTELQGIGQQDMTLTALRATTMLLTYAGLLEDWFLVEPVQCLVAPEWG